MPTVALSQQVNNQLGIAIQGSPNTLLLISQEPGYGESTIPSNALSGVQTTSKVKSSKPIINRNLSALRRETPEETIEALIKHIEDIGQFLDYLYERKMEALDTEDNGVPRHGQVCRALGGQYLSLTSTYYNSIIPVRHGLGKKPQGWIQTSSQGGVNGDALGVSTAIIARNDEMNIPAATSQVCYFILSGIEGTQFTGVLF